MFKTKNFEIIDKKSKLSFLNIIAEALIYFAGLAVFLLLYFSVFDKEYDIIYVRSGIAAGAVLGLITLMLKRHKLAALILDILCIFGIIFINFDIIRETLMQIINFARTHASFTLDDSVYSVFLQASFFVFAAVLACMQNFRLSFIPLLLFLGGTTAYIVVLNKPYDTEIYILYLIILLSEAAYSFSAETSAFLGFVSFGVFGLAALIVASGLNSYVGEEAYKEQRNNNSFLNNLDQTSFVKRFYPDITISALTEGQLLSYTINGTVSKQLMFIITLSEFENDFCLKSYTGDVYTGMGWTSLSDEQKNSLPESSPENIETDIISADYNGQSLIFNTERVDYSLEIAETVKTEFTPYFTADKTGFYELSTEYLSIYDLTPEGISLSLYSEMSQDAAEKLISREEAYREFMYENYLDVPEGIRERLESEYGDLRETELTSVLLNDLKTRLNENISFTIAPEPIEEGADPIEFTLDIGEADSNRLASVGIMVLRYLGCPARYAEGAAISADYRETALKVGDNYKIDVYNLDAAAYGEIYIDGLGWLPVNFMPDNAREIVNAQTEALNSVETKDLGEEIKTAASPYVKGAVKAAAKIIGAAAALLVIILIARRYIILLLRAVRLRSKNGETRKKTLYGYTEAVKVFFGENIFEGEAVDFALNEYLYSPASEYNCIKIYKEAKAAAKEQLKKTGFIKKIKAAMFKPVL
ncbi:MAG: transglutaminase family protein [Clostridiales bacterium]|nr:transglutaminase family protein [Clostridiales bacterium]